MNWSEDEFGVIYWETSPAKERVDDLMGMRKIVARDLCEDFITARGIAVTVFGKTWEAHVLEIYDRLLALQGE